MTARASYEKGSGHIISDTSLINSIAGNLAIVLALLAERRQDQNVLMTATFVGFDGTKFKPNRPTRPVTDEYVQLQFSHSPVTNCKKTKMIRPTNSVPSS